MTMTYSLDPAVSVRALNARDPRFDGVFFVGITTTRIYCRPVCPSRAALDRNRRFFDSAAAAESAGFRPCLRCRPELAPGRALCDAVSRLAHAAVHRISSGALNGRSVETLARELDVSERHLRRALEREIGVSPLELAQTHRLLLAKRLLADTDLSVTHVAYASGFQSLRRFNAVFLERYGMSPSALRRGSETRRDVRPHRANDLVRLTLAYRAPLDWDTLLAMLTETALPGVEIVEGRRWGRTVRLDGRTGVVFAEDDRGGQVKIDVSLSLLPVLMPLLSRLRHLFDLDAEPTIVDECLAQAGLESLVRERPGLRIPGAFDGFELAACLLLGDDRARVLGDLIDTGVPGLTHLAPSPAQFIDANVPRALTELRLEPGSDPVATREALLAIDGIDDKLATTIVMRALQWPDAFPSGDSDGEQWRPWRAYAYLHMEAGLPARR